MRGVNVSLAIGVSAIIYGLLTLGPDASLINALNALTDLRTINLLATLTLALFLAHTMWEVGILSRATKAITSLSTLLGAITIPMLVGLIPMPGGAVVSAMMAQELYFRRMGLGADEASYINYWFRHVWVTVWPLYQTVILSSSILSVSIKDLISSTWVVALPYFISGLIVTSYILKKFNYFSTKSSVSESFGNLKGLEVIKELLLGIWPFIIIATLALGTSLDIKLVILLTLIPIIIIYRPNKGTYVNSLKFALSPKIIALIITVMLFRQYIISSDLSHELIKDLTSLGISPAVVAPLLTFLLGLVGGGEFVFVAVGFPALIPLILNAGVLNKYMLSLAMLGGFLGAILAPSHLCIVLTTERYGTRVNRVYRYTLPSSILTLLISLILINLLKI